MLNQAKDTLEHFFFLLTSLSYMLLMLHDESLYQHIFLNFHSSSLQRHIFVPREQAFYGHEK